MIYCCDQCHYLFEAEDEETAPRSVMHCPDCGKAVWEVNGKLFPAVREADPDEITAFRKTRQEMSEDSAYI